MCSIEANQSSCAPQEMRLVTIGFATLTLICLVTSSVSAFGTGSSSSSAAAVNEAMIESCPYPPPLEVDPECCYPECMANSPGLDFPEGFDPCAPVTAMPIDLRNGQVYELAEDLHIPSSAMDVVWRREYAPGTWSHDPGGQSMRFPSVYTMWVPDPEDESVQSDPWYGNDPNWTYPRYVYLVRAHVDARGLTESEVLALSSWKFETIPTGDEDTWFDANGQDGQGNLYGGYHFMFLQSGTDIYFHWPWGQRAKFALDANGSVMSEYKTANDGKMTYGFQGANADRVEWIKYERGAQTHHYLDVIWDQTSGDLIESVKVYEGEDDQDDLVAKVEYTYHDGTGSYHEDVGSEGDLVSVKVYRQTTGDSAGQFGDVRQTLYRYYRSDHSTAAGPDHHIKMILRPKAAAAFAADVGAGNIFTAEDDPTSGNGAYDFANHYFQYSDPGYIEGNEYLVTTEEVTAGCVTCGGGGGSYDKETFSYDYADAYTDDADGGYWTSGEENDFLHIVAVTRPDGNKEFYFIGAVDTSSQKDIGKLRRKIVEDQDYEQANQDKQIFTTEWAYNKFGRVTTVTRRMGRSWWRPTRIRIRIRTRTMGSSIRSPWSRAVVRRNCWSTTTTTTMASLVLRSPPHEKYSRKGEAVTKPRRHTRTN